MTRTYVVATQLVIESKERNLLAVLVKQKEVNARHYVLVEKKKGSTIVKPCSNGKVCEYKNLLNCSCHTVKTSNLVKNELSLQY